MLFRRQCICAQRRLWREARHLHVANLLSRRLWEDEGSQEGHKARTWRDKSRDIVNVETLQHADARYEE